MQQRTAEQAVDVPQSPHERVQQRTVEAAGLLGAIACFSDFDISVAFLHSRMDEVVFVHSTKADQLVRQRRAVNGTRRPGGVQWHTDVTHARAVIVLLGLDVETSKPPPTLESKYCPGKQDSAGGDLFNIEDEFEDEDRSAYRSAAGTLLYHGLDRPDIQFSYSRCTSGFSCPWEKHLALVKHIAQVSCGTPGARLAVPTAEGTNQDRGLHRRRTGH